ncbi:FKBP-type peptidyl-prolyl cis-trans isomerase [Pedobacter sp. UYP30]|uniref:FKBP-type peptidyl-prolyl cis-trans isomerase n=1 Tax=Pedobacter sp. UYP30 TaxID=1756400 RepID=UPI003393C8E6
MKKTILTITIAALSLTGFAQKKKATVKKTTIVSKTVAQPGLKTNLDSVSYAFGTSIGASLKTTGITTFNFEALTKGLKAAFSGETQLLTQQQAEEKIQAAITKVNEAKNSGLTAEGKKFLAENGKRPGVKTTASGLQYEILKQGTGPKPILTDSVLVHYKGTLLNGKQFDSSYDRGEPITLALDGVIKAWTEGLQLMPTGSKYKFFVPYNLGYGARGAGQDIPPYSTLIFEIELLKVNGK